MWKKIKAVIITCLVFLSWIGGFILGMLFYSKKLDKPETAVINETNIDIAKIKAKGDGNVSVTLPVTEKSDPVVPNDSEHSGAKKKFKLFKKKQI
jgi:hypothetical protein